MTGVPISGHAFVVPVNAVYALGYCYPLDENVMNEIVFAQESIFHLYRLGHVVFGKSGARFRLAIKEDMNALIRYCDRSRDSSISRQFDAFLDSVSDEVLQGLVVRQLVRSSRVAEKLAA